MHERGPSHSAEEERSDVWVVLLAGGDGRRLEEVARSRYGHPRPKQYCDFGCGRTLIGQTIERARRLVPDDRIVVVTTRAHRWFADESLRPYPEVHRVEQPANLDTTPGILLPLLYVLDRDPEARVVVMPSDHNIEHDSEFVSVVGEALESLRDHWYDVLLLGAPAHELEEGYGWIVSFDSPREHWHRVADFREKPPPTELPELIAEGAVRNTFVIVSSASELVTLIAKYVPEWHEALTASRAPKALERAYASLPRSNFSSEVLEPARSRLRVVPLGEVGWDDIGTPERLARAGASRPPPEPRSASSS